MCLYALHYLQDVDLAEDIVQESYAALWEKLQEGAHVLNRKSYLYMMVHNRCLDHLRKKGLPTESLKPYDTYGIIDDDDAQERSQTEARLWTAIDSLPEKCRKVFILSKRDGLKYEEIAEDDTIIKLPSIRIHTKNTHGTGCTLSSAFAAALAKGEDLTCAARSSKKYIEQAIVSGAEYIIGNGHGPVNHFFTFSGE